MPAGLFFLLVFAIIMLGGAIISFPERVIDIQKWLYSLVNWRMEPISMSKEIRNTRFMGLLLIVFTIGASIYYCLQ